MESATFYAHAEVNSAHGQTFPDNSPIDWSVWFDIEQIVEGVEYILLVQ